MIFKIKQTLFEKLIQFVYKDLEEEIKYEFVF